MDTIREAVVARLAKNEANRLQQLADWEAGREAMRARRAASNAEADAAYRKRWAEAPVIEFVEL
tara:strand:+ start:254 stop:445 length:192 start_codon:yes stop_codon:yes gene_type:complete